VDAAHGRGGRWSPVAAGHGGGWDSCWGVKWSVRTAPGEGGGRGPSWLCFAVLGSGVRRRGFDSAAADGGSRALSLLVCLGAPPSGSCHAWMWMCSCHVTLMEPYSIQGCVKT
jgi:hypothetical protein